MIRKLNEEDYIQLFLLEQEIFSFHQKMSPVDFKEIPFSKDIYNNLLQNKNYLIYGYIIDKKIVGAIYVNKRNNIYYVDDIVVKKEFRNKKVGTKLFNFIEQKAIDANIKSILLDVWWFNEGAIKFYENLGYMPKTIKYGKIIKKEG